MKAAELRNRTIEELEKELLTLTKDQFRFRMEESTGQLVQTHVLKEVKKDIARVKTVLQEKKQKQVSE